MHSKRNDREGTIENTKVPIKHLDLTLFKKIVSDMMVFDEMPKRITFSGLGEPLLNPKLPNMIAHLRNSGYNGRIDIITNGVALTPKLADNLVLSGVSRIQISVQALTSERYQEIAGVGVNIDRFLENVRYLYQHKGKSEVFVKIIDANLQNEHEKAQFYQMFGNISDQMWIEHLIVMQQQMKSLGTITDYYKNLHNEVVPNRDVCSIAFYFIQVTVDGKVFLCPTPGLPKEFNIGDVTTESIFSIFNGEKRINYLKTMLKDSYKKIEFCSKCGCAGNIPTKEEYLDETRERILSRLDHLYVNLTTHSVQPYKT
jgi:radical SAM protein with 4Fe4S-binding SPASM domain